MRKSIDGVSDSVFSFQQRGRVWNRVYYRLCADHIRTGGGGRERGQRREGNTMNDVKKEPAELPVAPSLNHSRHDSGTGDELLSSVSLYRRRPRLLHGTVLPFLALLYPGWMYAWFGVYGAAEYPEAGLLALAAIGIAHVLTVLSGYWSVHAHCWLTCSKVNMRAKGCCVRLM